MGVLDGVMIITVLLISDNGNVFCQHCRQL